MHTLLTLFFIERLIVVGALFPDATIDGAWFSREVDLFDVLWPDEDLIRPDFDSSYYLTLEFCN